MALQKGSSVDDPIDLVTTSESEHGQSNGEADSFGKKRPREHATSPPRASKDLRASSVQQEDRCTIVIDSPEPQELHQTASSASGSAEINGGKGTATLMPPDASKPVQREPTKPTPIQVRWQGDISDNAVITEGIVPLILEASGLRLNIVTCGNSRLLHIRQNDKWSCGFRNLQMLLSALLPQLTQPHPYWEIILRQQGFDPCVIPTIAQQQTLLERAWADGFDKKGAEHYKNRIQGRKCWIGALEVATLLSYVNIDSTVVQFIRCRESREMLGRFIWCYFAKKMGPEGCSLCNGTDDLSLSSLNCASELLEFASTPVGMDIEVECCSCPLSPLYLQWEGHSVTLVGAEKGGNGINLLVFDPLKDGCHLKKQLGESTCSGGKALHSMRLPANKLLGKDCQVVLASCRPLSVAARDVCRQEANSVTAAEDAVRRTVQQGRV